MNDEHGHASADHRDRLEVLQRIVGQRFRIKRHSADERSCVAHNDVVAVRWGLRDDVRRDSPARARAAVDDDGLAPAFLEALR